jgi:hypothetical protein
VLRHLIVEGDLSAYGLGNAVTNYSQDVGGYDRATEFKALGGKLIELALATGSSWPTPPENPEALLPAVLRDSCP